MLVPAWRDVPFFVKPKSRGRSLRARMSLRALRGPGAPVGKRTLIWDGADGEVVAELVERGGDWEELYDPTRVRELWTAARAGEGNAHHQDVFEGIVYREAFTPHLALLASGPCESLLMERSPRSTSAPSRYDSGQGAQSLAGLPPGDRPASKRLSLPDFS